MKDFVPSLRFGLPYVPLFPQCLVMNGARGEFSITPRTLLHINNPMAAMFDASNRVLVFDLVVPPLFSVESNLYSSTISSFHRRTTSSVI